MLNRISELISAKNLSFSSVERQLGFGNGSIKRWDKSMPSIDKVALLANFLNVSIDYLFTGKEPHTTLSATLSSVPALPQEDAELLDLFHHLPPEKQIAFRAKLDGYVECLSDTASAEPLKKIAE